MSFQISALPQSKFQHLFPLPVEQLASFRTIRMIADKKPGFPCRVSLQDAEIGEEVLLVHYEHQPANTPYHASHAVFVRPTANEANPAINEVPEMLLPRTLSLRVFDETGMMIRAELAKGDALASLLDEMFLNPRAAYVHIHFANAGCYAARADRA